MNTALSTARSTTLHIKDNPYRILPHSAAIKFHNLKLPTYHAADPALLTVSAYTRQTIPAMLNSNYIGYVYALMKTAE